MKGILLILFFAIQACAPSLDKGWEWNNTAIATEESEPEDSFRVINATSYEEWVYLDLEENILIEPEEPEDSLEWDLGFMRYHIKLNSGIHGSGTVESYVVEEEDFETYTEAPQEGYQKDLLDENDDGIPEYVCAEWYEYDPETHILTPAERFYIMKSRNDRFFKFQVQGYYSDAGTSGHLSVYWEEIETYQDEE